MKNYHFIVLMLFFVSSCSKDSDIKENEQNPEIDEIGISDIKSFLDTCPENDPFINEIRQDFEIRLNGEIVKDIACITPASSMHISEYQNPLIVQQALRIIRRMKTGPLPWTDESLYDWMKNSIDGIDIRDDTPGGRCCQNIDGKVFISIRNLDQSNRYFKRKWIGISSTIDLLAHEARHRSGPGHVSCCGINGGCDQVYDLDNISSFGVQLWLNQKWLNNEIDMGLSSFSDNEVKEKNRWFGQTVIGFQARFCE